MNEVINCRSEEGITIGLIDSLISISRVLAKRPMNSLNIAEALCDLASDEDFNFIAAKSAEWSSRRIDTPEASG